MSKRRKWKKEMMKRSKRISEWGDSLNIILNSSFSLPKIYISRVDERRLNLWSNGENLSQKGVT